MRSTGAEQVLTGPEFKKYIAMIRNKGNVYKAKRSEVCVKKPLFLHQNTIGFESCSYIVTSFSHFIYQFVKLGLDSYCTWCWFYIEFWLHRIQCTIYETELFYDVIAYR